MDTEPLVGTSFLQTPVCQGPSIHDPETFLPEVTGSVPLHECTDRLATRANREFRYVEPAPIKLFSGSKRIACARLSYPSKFPCPWLSKETQSLLELFCVYESCT
jgi:hypothetical protein